MFLIGVVLLQQGSSADLAGAFGGQGSQTAFGPRAAANVLTQLTTWAADHLHDYVAFADRALPACFRERLQRPLRHQKLYCPCLCPCEAWQVALRHRKQKRDGRLTLLSRFFNLVF